MILAWKSNYQYEVWYEITNPFLNFNDPAFEVCERICNLISYFMVFDYVSILGLRLVRDDIMGSRHRDKLAIDI